MTDPAAGSPDGGVWVGEGQWGELLHVWRNVVAAFQGVCRLAGGWVADAAAGKAPPPGAPPPAAILAAAGEKLAERVGRAEGIVRDIMTQKSLRVVVVEDDPLVLADLARIVADGGYRVVATATTAGEMADALARERPHVVVFDIHLPGGDGLEVFRAASREMAVGGIVVTGDSSAATLRRAGEREVAVFLTKPVPPDMLRTHVGLVANLAAALAATRRSVEALEAQAAAAGLRTGRDAVGIAGRRLARGGGVAEEKALALIQAYAAASGRPPDEVAKLVLRGKLTVQLAKPPDGSPAGPRRPRPPRPPSPRPPQSPRPGGQT